MEPGTWSLEPGAWRLQLVCNLDARFERLLLIVYSLESGVWSMDRGPGAYSLQPRPLSMELGTWSLEAGAQSIFRAWKLEPEAPSPGPRARSLDSGAWTLESRA